MSELQTFGEWTILHGKRELRRFEKDKNISYGSVPAEYPCLARAEISSDENLQTTILDQDDLVAMLYALRGFRL